MPSISRTALVSHSAADMFALVRDIESYPQFLPWCSDASVAEQSDTYQVASVYMDKRMQGLKFTTRNSLQADEAIHMGLVDGPFRKLSGVWRFTPLEENACKVELAIDLQVAYALADEQQCISVNIPDGTNAREALIYVLENALIVLSDIDAQCNPMALPLGVYGQRVADDYKLRPAERLEIYRPLLQDPMERRRKIARQS